MTSHPRARRGMATDPAPGLQPSPTTRVVKWHNTDLPRQKPGFDSQFVHDHEGPEMPEAQLVFYLSIPYSQPSTSGYPCRHQTCWIDRDGGYGGSGWDRQGASRSLLRWWRCCQWGLHVSVFVFVTLGARISSMAHIIIVYHRITTIPIDLCHLHAYLSTTSEVSSKYNARLSPSRLISPRLNPDLALSVVSEVPLNY